VEQTVQNALHAQAPYSIDHRIILPDGSIGVVHEQGEVSYDPSGRPVRMAGTVQDITLRKLAEEAIRKAERLSSLGTLAAGIAHEINNPIGAALIAAETALALSEQPPAHASVAPCLQSVIDSLVRCGRIVRSILRFSRDERTEKSLVSINALVFRARDLTRSHAERCQARLDVFPQDDLPEMLLNPLEIELVLTNIIHNAIVSGDAVAIRMTTSLAEDGVHVDIEDNGRGMSEEERLRSSTRSSPEDKPREERGWE
jgi:signal transduction histidine kinase